MWKDPDILSGKRPDFEKLKAYGFVELKNALVKDMGILDGAFTCRVHVFKSGGTAVEVLDNETGEEYVLAYIEDQVGGFVGSVRTACEEVLTDLAKGCFDSHRYKEEQTRKVIEYARTRYATEPEFPWEDENCILRDGRSGKWYAVLMKVHAGKIGVDEGGMVEIMNVKAPPERVAERLKNVGYHPAYHMNKKHWYTVLLNGTLPLEELYDCLEESYQSIQKKTL